MKVLIKMDLFLRDICQEIADLHTDKAMSLEPLIVYRCLQLNTTDFNTLQNSNDSYISFNSFLLASTEPEFANRVCSNIQENTETVPILFQIEIEKTEKNIWLGKTADVDSIMETITELVNLEMAKEKGWNNLDQMMISMGDLKHVEELYIVLLESIDQSNPKEIALLYENLGFIKFQNGSYDEAFFV
jgi:hypothetical protein